MTDREEIFTNFELVRAADRLMKKGELENNAVLVQILNEERAFRKSRGHAQDAIPGKMTVTVRELREAAKRANAQVPADAEHELYPDAVDPLVRDILAHREPQYIPGRVYRAADGKYWKRLITSNAADDNYPWGDFDTIVHFSDNTPARPLELMP